MVQRTAIFLLVFIFVIDFGVSSNVTVKTLVGCTIADLRRINDEYKSRDAADWSISFQFLNCNLTTLPNGFFDHVPNIHSIEIDNSNVSSVANFALRGMQQLRKLSITNNSNLKRCQPWAANNLHKLTDLHLISNGLSELDTFALRFYPKLTTLLLANNLIEDIPVGFFDFTLEIETLDLSGNRLHRTEAFTFKALLRLAHLNLENNKIDYIDPYTFTTTAHLQVLKLNGNQIVSLSSMVFYNLAWLEHLNLSGNALGEYGFEDNTFHQSSALKVLDISRNSLIGLHGDALNGLKSLKVFNASSNLMSSMQSVTFKNLQTVEVFDISNNQLTHLMDNYFADLVAVEVLDISRNALNSVQAFTFTDLPALRVLDLSANQLDSDNFIAQMVKLKSINLSNNQYSNLSLSLFDEIGSVNLQENPWNCTWLINRLLENPKYLSKIQFGQKFGSVNYEPQIERRAEELVCVDDNHTAKRNVIIINEIQNQSSIDEQEANKKKFSSINTYPRTFSKLLDNEFDYKACLLWSCFAVFLVIGLIRFGKYCFDRSERKSERYRISKQEEVQKNIDAYFAKNNSQNKEDA